MNKVELEILVEEMKELEAQKDAISDRIEEIKDSIKKDMNRRNKEVITTKNFEIKYTSYISEKFDTTAFRKTHAKLYEEFKKPSTSKRFSVISK